MFDIRLLSFITHLLRLEFSLLFLLFCVPFIILTAILYHMQSKIQGFGAIARTEKGDVSDQFIGALVCASVVALLSIIMSALTVGIS